MQYSLLVLDCIAGNSELGLVLQEIVLQEGLLESCVAIQCIVLQQAARLVRKICIAIHLLYCDKRHGRWAGAGRWARLLGAQAAGCAGRWARAGSWRAGTGRGARRQARQAARQGHGRHAAWALGARPGRAGWPGLCTRCTPLGFQPGFFDSVFS